MEKINLLNYINIIKDIIPKKLYFHDEENIIFSYFFQDLEFPDAVKIYGNDPIFWRYLDEMSESHLVLYNNAFEYKHLELFQYVMKKYNFDNDITHLKLIGLMAYHNKIPLPITGYFKNNIITIIQGALEGGQENLYQEAFSLLAGKERVGLFMIDAVRGGNINLINNVIEYGKERNCDWNEGMIEASLRGHFEIVKFLIEKEENKENLNFNQGMAYASQGGHQNIVNFFIEKGEKDNLTMYWDWGLIMASSGGRRKLVKFFIEKGAKQFKLSSKKAKENGYVILAEELNAHLYNK